MKKYTIMAALGNFYRDAQTGIPPLPFAYNNVATFQTHLANKNWVCHPPMLDINASRKNLTERLHEAINNCQDNDWLIFYYTGHASKYFLDSSPDSATKTYCITYSEKLKSDYLPDLSEFFSEDDYAELVKLFQEKVPNGHLISILDCCYAYGLIQSFGIESPNHTIIAAASSSSKARYDTNSAFFIAYSQSWDLPFKDLQSNLNKIFKAQNLPGKCVIKTATKFENQTI